MIDNVLVSLYQQLTAQVRIEIGKNRAAIAGFGACSAHAVFPPFPPVLIPYDSAIGVNFSLNIPRPRLSLDITVPIGMFKISETSLYANSCTSASNTTS